jgi:hypothetical protein
VTPELAADLGTAISSVVQKQRSGFTWTRDFKFDVDDPTSMASVYDRLGEDSLYVVARTHYRLEERPMLYRAIAKRTEGVGLWRDDMGQIWADDVVLFFAPKASRAWALNRAKAWNQLYILEVSGKTRSFEFLPVSKPAR